MCTVQSLKMYPGHRLELTDGQQELVTESDAEDQHTHHRHLSSHKSYYSLVYTVHTHTHTYNLFIHISI